MINYDNTTIGDLWLHGVGRPLYDEPLFISQAPAIINHDVDVIKKFLLKSFREEGLYAFGEDPSEVGQLCAQVLGGQVDIREASQRLAEKLYASSERPSIKSGYLLVCQFDEILVEDEIVSALGIFKLESEVPFIKINANSTNYTVSLDDGFPLASLDKGCLILDTEKESGYKVCLVDKASRTEAEFWKSGFLELQSRSDDYNYTTHYMSLTKSFVDEKKASDESFGLEEELELMQASEDFFQREKKFNANQYMNSVAQDESMAKDFMDYVSDQGELAMAGQYSDFDISDLAVKKNSKFFRSVIKLDKNFHLYVHGDRTKIERGRDEKGKFYKLYYEEES